MSDYYQIFVPIDIHWQPSEPAAAAAVALLRTMVSCADKVEAEFFDALRFQDPGGNWSGVRCPACRTEIDDWFFKVMTERHASALEDLRVTTPCCARATTLDALDFVWPASFFRFRLCVMNSRVAVTDEQIGRLEACLGSRLKLIWRRI